MLLRGLNQAWNTYFQGLLGGAKLMAVVQSTSTWMSLRASSSCSAAGGVFFTWKQQLNLLPIVRVSSFDTLKKIYHNVLIAFGELVYEIPYPLQYIPSVSELNTRTNSFRSQLVNSWFKKELICETTMRTCQCYNNTTVRKKRQLFQICKWV